MSGKSLSKDVYSSIIYIPKTVMSRKKKEKINIKSSETRIFFGLVLLILGLALVLTPFVKDQAKIFIYISTLLGWPSMIWGVGITALSINLLTQGKNFGKRIQIFGFLVLSVCLNALLTFWVPANMLEDTTTLQKAGGTFGKILHTAVNGTMGDILELIVILILLIVAFSFITGIQIKQIAETISQLFSKISVNDLKSKIGDTVGDARMIINDSDSDENGDLSIDGQEQIDIEQQQHLIPETSSLNTATPVNVEPQLIDNNRGERDINTEPSKPKYLNWKYPSIDKLQEPVKTEQPKEAYKNEAQYWANIAQDVVFTAEVLQRLETMGGILI